MSKILCQLAGLPHDSTTQLFQIPAKLDEVPRPSLLRYAEPCGGAESADAGIDSKTTETGISSQESMTTALQGTHTST